MHQRSRVLIVDDNLRNIAILKRILEKTCSLCTATTGEEALAVAPQFLPDLVLLDIMMPGIDGYETCRRLRARPDLAHVKIIMVSAKALTSERLRGYEAGADDYVTKPFDDEELLAKVKVFLHLKSVEEVNQLKNNLLIFLNHETRTPLTHILGPLELLQNSAGLTEEHRQLAGMISRGAKRLNTLIERVSFLNSLRSGGIVPAFVECDLTEVIGQAVEALQTAAHEARIRLVMVLPERLTVSVDPDQIQWVVTALLDNAMHASAPGQAIEIRLDRVENAMQLSVIDSGTGIAPRLLPSLFEEFAVPDIAHHARGLCLSLATARAILRLHDGTINARSDPGGQTVFTLQFKVAESDSLLRSVIQLMEPSS